MEIQYANEFIPEIRAAMGKLLFAAKDHSAVSEGEEQEGCVEPQDMPVRCDCAVMQADFLVLRCCRPCVEGAV